MKNNAEILLAYFELCENNNDESIHKRRLPIKTPKFVECTPQLLLTVMPQRKVLDL